MDNPGGMEGRKPSLFAQRMKDAKQKKLQNNPATPVQKKLQPSNFGERSFIVTGSESAEIHKENSAKLAAMTAEEIELERNKLLAEMDPKLVEFLRSRKQNLLPSGHEIDGVMDITDSSVKHEEQMDTEICSGTVVHELTKKWPDMGVLEDEKLKWMEELPDPTPPKPGMPYNARFDFNGTLLPYNDENLDVRKGLHHHGEEPERPGYTLQELIQLSRSSVLQQRIVAINTLANIMEKANLYVECLDKPLLPLLLDAELFLMLRFSLDDASRPVISAALAALCNLLVNSSDEMCLDSLLGIHGSIYQPTLYTVIDLKEDELSELKDPELLRLDVIRGALRTHLLSRFRYILHKMNPEPTEIVHIVKCLIRITRHSYEATLAVITCSGLLDSVWMLMTEDSINFYPDTLKFLRVVACRTKNFAHLLIEKYPIVDVIMQILSGNANEKQPESMRLMLEGFYLWQTLLNYNLAVDQISAFTPVLNRLLSVHIEHTGVESSAGDQEHGVALMSTLASAFKFNYTKISKPLIHSCILAAQKWISQIMNSQSVTRSMCKLVGAALSCVTTIIKYEQVGDVIEEKLLQYFQSPAFTESISLLRKFSWLLSDDIDKYKGNTADNLPSLAAVPPTIQPQCTQPLFDGLTAFVLATNKNKLSELFLKNSAWEIYLRAIVQKEKLNHAANHWFAKQEIKLLCTILFINRNCETIDNDLVHHTALTLAAIVHNDDKPLLHKIFEKIIFNREYFSTNVLALSAQLEDVKLINNQKKNSVIIDALNNLPDIESYYMNELGLRDVSVSLIPFSLTATDKGCEPVLPSDWQFLPILHLYNKDGQEENALKIVTCSLQWILILEHFHSDIANMTPITARFSRLCCVFMAGNDLFRDVTDLLRELLRILISSNEAMDFDSDVPGLNSFYDFYRQLVDHFSGVSYGDAVFGQYILVPLQQRFKVKFRKLVWSEQASLVRILSTPIEQLVIPFQAFLEPCETDTQLLATYLQYLGTGRIRPQWSPVLYRVAVHHVATFIKQYPENKFTKFLKQKVETMGNQVLRSKLLEYQA